MASRLREQGNTMVGIGNLSAGCLESLSATLGAPRGCTWTRPGVHEDEFAQIVHGAADERAEALT
ncbi:hypothetical protein [Pyrodictium abyssi]|uniref:hypothetical protein n=1 Tax=Pyrodictium abyssi TaxID=54256 RepID=UPI0030C67128